MLAVIVLIISFLDQHCLVALSVMIEMFYLYCQYSNHQLRWWHWASAGVLAMEGPDSEEAEE